MQNTPRERLQQFAHCLQTELWSTLEVQWGPLSEKGRLLVAVLSLLPLEHVVGPSRGWRGRPSKDRSALAAAFLAKSIYGLGTTRQLLELLRSDRQVRSVCGWNSVERLPHEATFSRAFAWFAQSELPQRLHAAVIADTQQGRLIGHIARDSTAIEARERFPVARPQRKARPRRAKPGRPRQQRGPCKRAKASERGTRLERQRQQTLCRQLTELPQTCSLGVKASSKGYQQYWRGYKLHLDVADGQIPITALLTGAGVHDSQVAIPLMTITSERVTYLYDLMDSAYDAQAIRAHSRSLGHRPITDHPKRRRKIGEHKVPLRKNSRSWTRVSEWEVRAEELTEAEALRLRERSLVERVFSRLKDEFGARSIRVRGARKIMAHLMFGVLALTVDQLLKLSG